MREVVHPGAGLQECLLILNLEENVAPQWVTEVP